MITQNNKICKILKDVQEWEVEEYKPINILHEPLKRTLVQRREFQTERMTTLTKTYVRLPAE